MPITLRCLSFPCSVSLSLSLSLRSLSQLFRATRYLHTTVVKQFVDRLESRTGGVSTEQQRNPSVTYFFLDVLS